MLSFSCPKPPLGTFLLESETKINHLLQDNPSHREHDNLVFS